MRKTDKNRNIARANILAESRHLAALNESNIPEGTVFPWQLKEGQMYAWEGGAEYQEIKYMGQTKNLPDIKVGSSMGKGFIFEWANRPGSFMELGQGSVTKYVRIAEPPAPPKPQRKPRVQTKAGGNISIDANGNLVGL